jgi:hypothetical protein
MHECETISEWYREGEAKVRGEKLFEGHFVYHKSLKDWIIITPTIIKLG